MDLVQTMLSCPVPRMEIVGHGRDVSRFPLPIARCFSLNGPPFQVELSVRFLCQQFLLYHGNLDVGVCTCFWDKIQWLESFAWQWRTASK